MKKYVLFEEEQRKWEMIYCNNGKSEATDEEILKSIFSSMYVGKFNANEHTCINNGGIKNDTKCYILTDFGKQYIWQVGSRVTDREGFIIPHTYYVRKVGIIVE